MSVGRTSFSILGEKKLVGAHWQAKTWEGSSRGGECNNTFVSNARHNSLLPFFSRSVENDKRTNEGRNHQSSDGDDFSKFKGSAAAAARGGVEKFCGQSSATIPIAVHRCSLSSSDALQAAPPNILPNQNKDDSGLSYAAVGSSTLPLAMLRHMLELEKMARDKAEGRISLLGEEVRTIRRKVQLLEERTNVKSMMLNSGDKLKVEERREEDVLCASLEELKRTKRRKEAELLFHREENKYLKLHIKVLEETAETHRQLMVLYSKQLDKFSRSLNIQ